MSWFRVDDTMAFHAKVVQAGNESMGLWLRAGAWSASQLSDGFIPNAIANAIANPMAGGDDIARLVRFGLWEEVEGGYQFHDYSDYNPSGAEEKAKRKRISETRSEAGKKGAQARWSKPSDEPKPEAKAMANAMANESQTDGPIPSHPVDTSNEVSISPDSAAPRRKRATQIAHDWMPSRDTIDTIKAELPHLDLRAQHQQFIDHFTANGKPMKDWDAAWRNWMRRSPQFAGRPAGPDGITKSRNTLIFEAAERRLNQQESEPSEPPLWAAAIVEGQVE